MFQGMKHEMNSQEDEQEVRNSRLEVETLPFAKLVGVSLIRASLVATHPPLFTLLGDDGISKGDMILS